jgi:hypothetical protein
MLRIAPTNAHFSQVYTTNDYGVKVGMTGPTMAPSPS